MIKKNEKSFQLVCFLMLCCIMLPINYAYSQTGSDFKIVTPNEIFPD